jgi:hypothetical protein
MGPRTFSKVSSGRPGPRLIRTLGIIEGGIATRALGLVMEWAAGHQTESAEDWHELLDGGEDDATAGDAELLPQVGPIGGMEGGGAAPLCGP